MRFLDFQWHVQKSRGGQEHKSVEYIAPHTAAPMSSMGFGNSDLFLKKQKAGRKSFIEKHGKVLLSAVEEALQPGETEAQLKKGYFL